MALVLLAACSPKSAPPMVDGGTDAGLDAGVDAGPELPDGGCPWPGTFQVACSEVASSTSTIEAPGGSYRLVYEVERAVVPVCAAGTRLVQCDAVRTYVEGDAEPEVTETPGCESRTLYTSPAVIHCVERTTRYEPDDVTVRWVREERWGSTALEATP